MRALGVLLAALLVAPLAHAEEPSKSVCRNAYEQGQRLRRAKKLMSAREQFIVCSRDPCPTAFQPECLRWLGEVQSELPTVVVDVRRGDGVVTAAEVRVDGAVFASKIDGRAQALDPGEYTITVKLPDGATRTQTATVVEGVMAQRFVFDFAPRPPPPPVRMTSPWVYVLGGTSIAALGGFATFGIIGLGQRSDVIACTHDCSSSDVHTARRSLVVADVFLGVSILALAGAATLWFTTKPGPRRAALLAQ